MDPEKSKRQKAKWPKVPPPLTDAQKSAREKYMRLWHEQLPTKYSQVEKFNHGYPAGLPLKTGSKTLEIGAGIGGHLDYEDLSEQDYYCLEYRKEFCEVLAKRLSPSHVICGDIQQKQPWPNHSFDRIIAIHVLEHLPNLPLALKEIYRLLKSDGVFDVVIPCEGGLAHTLGRKVSAERLFRKHFKMDFTPIHKNEHVNTYEEIMEEVGPLFRRETGTFFPLRVPIATINLFAGFRFRPRIDSVSSRQV